LSVSIVINFITSLITFVFGILLLTGILFPQNRDNTMLMFGLVLVIYGVYRFTDSVSKLKQMKLQERLDRLKEEQEKLFNKK
jgi:amino acid permease